MISKQKSNSKENLKSHKSTTYDESESVKDESRKLIDGSINAVESNALGANKTEVRETSPSNLPAAAIINPKSKFNNSLSMVHLRKMKRYKEYFVSNN